MTVLQTSTGIGGDRYTFRPLRRHYSLLNSVHHPEAPWANVLMGRLRDLETCPKNPFPGQAEVNPCSVRFARIALSAFFTENLPDPAVGPISGGAVGVSWCLGAKQLEVIFAPDRSGCYILSKGNEILENGDFIQQNMDSLTRAIGAVLSD